MECLTRTDFEAVSDETLVVPALCAAQNLCAAVAFIVEERMPDVFHVHPDLMGSSGFEDAFHECDIAEALQDAVVCDGVFADARLRVKHRHLHSVSWIAGDVTLNASFVFFKVSPDECIVATSGCFVEELESEFCFCFRCFCHHEQAGGVLVDAVDESHGGVVRVVVRIVALVEGNGIDERSRVVPASRMHDQSGRFVDDHELVVFKDHVEGDVLGEDGVLIAWAVKEEGDDVARFHPIVALHRFPVGVDETCLCRLLNAVAGGVSEMVDEELVDSQQLLPFVCHETEMLIEPVALLFQFFLVFEGFGGEFRAVVDFSEILCERGRFFWHVSRVGLIQSCGIDSHSVWQVRRKEQRLTQFFSELLAMGNVK